MKAKAYSARGSGGMRLWNAAWIQCQEVSQQLGERLQQRGEAADKDQQQPTAGGAQVKSRVLETGKEREEEKEEKVGAPCSLAPASTSPTGVANNSGRASQDQMESRDSNTRDSAHITCFNLPFKADTKGGKGAKEVSQSPKSPGKEGKLMPVVPQDGGGGPGRRHSEADLKRGDPIGKCEAFPWKHSALGRSLSEGSCMSSLLSSECGSSPLSARHSHSRHLVVALQSPQKPYDISRNGSFCSGHTCCKSNGDREGGDPIQVSSVSLTDPSGDETQESTLLANTQAEENGSNVL